MHAKCCLEIKHSISARLNLSFYFFTFSIQDYLLNINNVTLGVSIQLSEISGILSNLGFRPNLQPKAGQYDNLQESSKVFSCQYVIKIVKSHCCHGHYVDLSFVLLLLIFYING